MATGNGFTTKLAPVAIAAIIVLGGVFSLVSVNGEIATLKDHVNEIQAKVATLDEVEARIDKLQTEVRSIETVRMDILQAICVAVSRHSRDARDCVRHVNGGG